MGRITVPLDGAPVAIGDGTPRLRTLRIPAGAAEESDLPFRVRLDGEREHLVTSLPWQVVGVAGELERLSPVVSGVNWAMDEHLPSGLTLLADTSWPSASPSPWGEATAGKQGPGQSIITDPSAPTGGTSVLRQEWEGVEDGQSPHFSFIGSNAVHEFGAVVMRLGADFDVPGELKGLTWIPAGGGFIWFGIYRGNATYGVQGAPSSQLNMRYVQRAAGQGGDRVSRFGVRDDVPLPKGEWFKFSWEIKYSSPQQVRAWVNSTLTIDMATDGMLVNPSGVPGGSATSLIIGGTNTGELQQHSTWGGGNGISAPATIVIDHARTAIWRAT